MSDPSHSVRLNVEWFLNSPLPPVVLAPETCSDSYSQLLPPEAAATLGEVLINVTATQTVEGHCVIQTRTMSGCSPFFYYLWAQRQAHTECSWESFCTDDTGNVWMCVSPLTCRDVDKIWK